MKYLKTDILEITSILFLLFIFIYNCSNPFFWDTIQLGSRHASFYIDSNFSTLLLPNYIDSGHIPSFGLYIATIWKLFGRTLLVSHVAVLPFILGIVYQLKKIIPIFFSKKHTGLVLLLLFLNPILLGQITLVSPDVPLVFFFLLTYNGILKNNKRTITIGIILLFLISMRGMMVAFCLLLFDIYENVYFRKKIKFILLSLFQRSKLYIPSLLIFISFNIYHFLETGWIGYHEGSPWAQSFERVDLQGFLRNIIVLVWRLLDFGFAIVWFILIILFFQNRKSLLLNKKFKSLLFLFLCLLIILPINMIWAKGLLGHRYLLPIYFTTSLITIFVLLNARLKPIRKRILILSWIYILSTGNFWVYPNKISQGWDATLAHIPYFNLREKAISHIENSNIDINKVSSFFPNTSTIDYIELNGDQRSFSEFNINSNYVLYSNIYNISDEEYNDIMSNYKLIKEFKSNSIFVNLYQKKQF